jgi:hypothetical protein
MQVVEEEMVILLDLLQVIQDKVELEEAEIRLSKWKQDNLERLTQVAAAVAQVAGGSPTLTGAGGSGIVIVRSPSDGFFSCKSTN